MADNPIQPRKYDSEAYTLRDAFSPSAATASQTLRATLGASGVLGGQVPSGSAVLGGVEAVKRRLASAVEKQRIAALKEALKYGEAGLDLVIQAVEPHLYAGCACGTLANVR
jgi:hypothetical protein